MERKRGRIKFYNSEKQYGFIVPLLQPGKRSREEQSDIYFNSIQLENYGENLPVKGDVVEFRLIERTNGNLNAEDVVRIPGL